jgi:putative membrane protein
MTTLILNIDRDNDFGRKAKINSPIIGEKHNLEAANKLGQVDPEDSDLNAIFLAIATYNSLKQEGKDVALATICGDINVGVSSDEILVKQLETVITKTKATEAIVISDGAEDEYIIPLVQSRLKINSIKRVNVKQSRDLEDTYYTIIKLLDDDKVKKQFILPIGLILIVWAIFALLDMLESGFGAILFTLGLYLLIRVFNWERYIISMGEEIKAGILTGRFSFYTTVIALIILAISIFYAYNQSQPDFSSEFWIIPILSFLKHMIWGIVSAGLIAAFGRVTDIYVREKRINWSYWIVPFSLFAFGFISSAIFESLYYSLIWGFSIQPFQTLHFIAYTLVGILIALMGAVTYHYIKETYLTDEQELQIKEETARLLEES